MITTPSASLSQVATQAYGRIGQIEIGASGALGGAADDVAGSSGASFGASLESAMQGVIESGHSADAQTTAALSGQGNLTDVVTAVSRAQLALQTTTVIRDRVVQAYQDIMKMSI